MPVSDFANKYRTRVDVLVLCAIFRAESAVQEARTIYCSPCDLTSPRREKKERERERERGGDMGIEKERQRGESGF